MYFILAKIVKTLHKTNSSVFIPHLACHTLSTFGSLVSKEGLKGKGTTGCSIFPFHSMSSFINMSSWLTKGNNMNKKGYDTVSWLFVFLEMSLPSFCIKSSGLNWKHSFFRLSGHHLLSHRHNVFTLYSLWVLLKSNALWAHLNFCSWTSWMLYTNGVARNGGHTYCMYLFCLDGWSTVPSDATYKT